MRSCAAATFLAVRNEFLEQFDDQLHEDFERAEGLLHASGGRTRFMGGDPSHHPPDDERAYDVWSVTGEQLCRSRLAIPMPPAFAAPASGSRAYQSPKWTASTGGRCGPDWSMASR